jgi:hypothetical protein
MSTENKYRQNSLIKEKKQKPRIQGIETHRDSTVGTPQKKGVNPYIIESYQRMANNQLSTDVTHSLLICVEQPA